jgi:ribosomal protein S14
MINFNKSQKRRLLLVEHAKRCQEKNFEKKNCILKALIANKNQKTKQTIYIKSIYKDGGTTSFNKQQNRCLYTGRIRGFQKSLRASRQALKKFAVFGNIQNLKKKSW